MFLFSDLLYMHCNMPLLIYPLNSQSLMLQSDTFRILLIYIWEQRDYRAI